MKDMIEFAREILILINTSLEWRKVPSLIEHGYATWVSNMLFYLQLVHSQIPLEFEEYIDKQLAEREDKYIKKKSINVPALPKFVDLFKDTSVLSRKFFYAFINLQERTRSFTIWYAPLSKEDKTISWKMKKKKSKLVKKAWSEPSAIKFKNWRIDWKTLKRSRKARRPILRNWASFTTWD